MIGNSLKRKREKNVKKKANIENLTPFSSHYQPEKNGRPKGSRNRSTIVREWLEVTQKLKNPITGENEELSQADMITLALISKARKGDVAAFKELMDSGFGKNVEVIEQHIESESNIVILPDGTKIKV